MARQRRQPEIIAGRVNGDGSIAAGDGFTVTKVSTGVYTLTLVSGFRLVSIAVSLGGVGLFSVGTDTYTERSARVGIINSSLAAADAAWNFVAAGVQQ